MNQPKRTQQRLFNVEEIRQLEQALFAQQDSYAVMQLAAKALLQVILEDYPQPLIQQRVHVLLGSGNNAGDGLLVATYLQQAGFSVSAYTVFASDFQGDAAKAYHEAVSQGITIEPFYPFVCCNHDIVIEGLFGIGFDRAAGGIAKIAIEHLNHCKAEQPEIMIYAIDVPAGIVADTGAALGVALAADKTVTFIGDKRGLHTASGRGCAGQVIVSPLGAKAYLAALPEPQNWRYQYALSAAKMLTNNQNAQQNIQQNTHKGHYGHSVIIGGGKGMFGAAALAAISALKVGVGKSSLYTHPDYQSQYHLPETALYEVMRCLTLEDLSAYSAVVLGPGLGRDAWGELVFQQVFNRYQYTQSAANLALLIDADGLYHLAANYTDYADRQAATAVITPHEAEAAKLLHTSVATIRSDKYAAVRQLAKRYHCVAVLKGSGTLISDGQQVWVNTSGNYYLATAGTGDVLAGIIGGYLAQGFSAIDAALYGVYRHGLAADDYLAAKSNKSLRASDLWDFL